ncbi:M81 family metallopeptidase [Bacillus sp. FJAT-50079]|uniref:M81 family metallopeptidase n=1 Tax=Bacillus sp. FJAT-50079 TaxID=2833577 RepID=UPI001BC9EC1E|nr:M81 family metallopeptidase [Bacillus sp. FJAT-50079]MBS4206646.1 M81 family metallopeptidase [Bacillus sp. FJAT-50079]
MKIVVGCLYHESNTFNPFYTHSSDFVLIEGEEVLDRLASTQVFKEAGMEVIPSIYAVGLSSGIVTEEAYRYFANKILEVIKNEGDIDGIWLHLHGSMTVENIGSGEWQLIKEIRQIVGDEVPISLALDIHGNLPSDLVDNVNIIRSYRTVPHVDQPETEVITAKLLQQQIINNANVRPVYLRLPIIIGGDTAIGAEDPLRTIFQKIEELELMEGIASASFFIGFSWADTENTASTIVIVPESNDDREYALEQAVELGNYIFSKRGEFTFNSIALEPDDAIKYAIESNESPIFISDTGDNTTGGAPGINTMMLKLFANQENLNGKKVCIASIFDEKAYEQVVGSSVGELVEVNVGKNYDENSQSIFIKGRLIAKGDLLGYLGSTSDKVGKVCTISMGNMDVVIADKAGSFITNGHFIAAGLDLHEYDIVIVKQGYLFAQLSEISKMSIFSISPGATYQYFNKLEFKNIARPLYPFDHEVSLVQAKTTIR